MECGETWTGYTFISRKLCSLCFLIQVLVSRCVNMIWAVGELLCLWIWCRIEKMWVKRRFTLHFSMEWTSRICYMCAINNLWMNYKEQASPNLSTKIDLSEWSFGQFCQSLGQLGLAIIYEATECTGKQAETWPKFYHVPSQFHGRYLQDVGSFLWAVLLVSRKSSTVTDWQATCTRQLVIFPQQSLQIAC